MSPFRRCGVDHWRRVPGEAVAAIVHDQYILVLPNYIYAFDLTAWGWIHLLVGVGLAVTGIFVLRGQT